MRASGLLSPPLRDDCQAVGEGGERLVPDARPLYISSVELPADLADVEEHAHVVASRDARTEQNE